MKSAWVSFVLSAVVVASIATHVAGSDNPIRNVPAGVRVVPDIAYREGASKAWRLDLAMPREPGHMDIVPPAPALYSALAEVP